MDCSEFSSIRSHMGKTRDELAAMLRLPSEIIQGYEQGRTPIPAYAERQMLFLLVQKKSTNKNIKNCWQVRMCPVKWKNRCAAWKNKAGRFCWFINGTYCNGEFHPDWNEKILICRQCVHFKLLLPD